MMKIKTSLMAAAALLALTACRDMLSLAPENQIASESMWRTESLADKGMAGLYKNFYKTKLSRVQLRHNDFDGLNRQGWMGMEFQTSFMVDNYPLKALTESAKNAGEFLVWYEWKWAYTSIHQINDAIANLHKAGMSREKYERYLSEARFLRAWFYARLARIYGDVPIYLKPVPESECTRTQSTEAEVWEAVIADLTACIDCPNFPDNTLSAGEGYGRPSKGAAYALRGLARMYTDAADRWTAAAADFQKVADCGYGFWEGDWAAFFTPENERSREMIFPLQFDETVGFCDNLQLMIGGRDSFDSWSNSTPSPEFVDSFQNADGSVFKWTEVPGLEAWNSLTPSQREVYFLRDGLRTDRLWSEAERGKIRERIRKIGQDVFDAYYLNEGNEARIRRAYDHRDPRLKAIVLTPYEPFDTFKSPSDNDGKIQIGKQWRWPYLREGDDGGDYYMGGAQDRYLYKKFNFRRPEDLIDRLRCHLDWPLIRYTDVALLQAECEVQCGRLDRAAELVNAVRSRAHMPAVAVGSREEMMEAVRYERRVELCLEGQDFFDEWRWGTFKAMKFQGQDRYCTTSPWGEWNGVVWYYSDLMRHWAAPAEECQRNPALRRTEGWAY